MGILFWYLGCLDGGDEMRFGGDWWSLGEVIDSYGSSVS
jgi:hypothetical protein